MRTKLLITIATLAILATAVPGVHAASPPTPTNVVLSHNTCTADDKLRVAFEPNHIATPPSPNNIQYEVRVTDTGSGDTYSRWLRTSQADLTAFEGRTYQATARTCYGIHCSNPSAPSAAFTIPKDELCQPYGLRFIPGNGKVTARWTVQPNALSYEIEDQDGNSIETPNGVHTLTDLTNGDEYQYRVRAKGNTGTGPWSDWEAVTPEEKYWPNPPYSRGGGQSHDHPVHDPRIRLHAAGDVPERFSVNAEINVRWWGPGSSAWQILPTNEYQLHRRYRVHKGHGIFEPVVTGLRPGTTYYFMFQGVNGDRRSGWTEQQSLTTRGEAPPGSTPTNPPPANP